MARIGSHPIVALTVRRRGDIHVVGLQQKIAIPYTYYRKLRW